MTSAVAQVQQFESDEALAAKLQKEYDDENQAQQMQEEINLDDEFSRVTKAHDAALSDKKAKQLHSQLNY